MTDSIKSIVQMDVKHLRTVLKDVVGVVEARNTIPILSDVLFTAARDAVKARAETAERRLAALRSALEA